MSSLNKIIIQPIGGLKEIGSNLCIFNGGSENVIIDCGILFPYESCFNLDYLIPDLSQIDKRITHNIIFTHGHEDHIGAIFHIIENFPNIKIWASKFTTKLIQRKLGFHKMTCPIHIFDENSILEFKDLTFHPIALNHSIPETFGFVIQDKKKYWSTFFASDFKIDPINPYEKPSDIEKVSSLISQTPNSLAMLDSTNILSSGKTLGEGELIHDIEKIIKEAPSRVFITQFSSNIHRMQTIINICHKLGKKLIPVGRSMEFYMGAASDTDLIEIPDKLIMKSDQIDLKSSKNVFLVAGCQGDFFSSLKRIVFGEYRDISLHTEDTVVFSSKVIPGNEKTVYRMYNQIIESGAYLITPKDFKIHASGHPSQEDLHYVLRNTDFTHHLPIHGETLFLKRHQEFIEQNYPKISSHIALNFDLIELSQEGKIKVTPGEPLPPILIHGRGIEIERSQVSQRRKIAQSGLVIISAVSSNINIHLSGLPLFCDEHIEHIESLLRNHFRKHLKNRKEEFKRQELSVIVRKYFMELIGYKPTCIVLL